MIQAKYVYERLSFKRGADPKETMGIGISQIIYDKWNKFQQERGVGSINLINDKRRGWGLSCWASSLPGSHQRIYDKAQLHFKGLLKEHYHILGPVCFIPIEPEFIDPFIKAHNRIYPEWRTSR
jgi:hypothetical protein